MRRGSGLLFVVTLYIQRLQASTPSIFGGTKS